MRKDQERFVEALRDFEIRMDYSGRGMYGKTCPGVVVEDVREVYAEIADFNLDRPPRDDEPTAGDLIRKCREDTMGRDVIVYLPYHPGKCSNRRDLYCSL